MMGHDDMWRDAIGWDGMQWDTIGCYCIQQGAPSWYAIGQNVMSCNEML